MLRRLILAAASTLALTAAARAEAPAVVADIPPVQSLVAMVMGDLGTPDLLVQPGASPHGYALRPSEARALSDAQLVFWIGAELEPWLQGSLEALAGNAKVVELMAVEGTTVLEFREGAQFEGHDHGGGDHEGDDHAGHDHDDHGHVEGAHDHDHEDHDHAEAEHDHEGHDAEVHDNDHHGHDPHAWLDPENGRVWLDAIAAELAAADPDNADAYRANAETAKAGLATLSEEIAADLAPLRGGSFVVFHDAYHYFEAHFDFPAAGSITLSDASAPSPARIEEVHDKVAELNVTCAFSEPQFNAGLVQTVFQGTEARTGVMDPLGTALEPGPDLYPQLLRDLADSLTGCLSD